MRHIICRFSDRTKMIRRVKLISEEVKIISQPNALAGPQSNYPNVYANPPVYPDFRGYGNPGYNLNDLPPGYGTLPAGRGHDYERYIPTRSNTIKSDPNINRVKRGKLNSSQKTDAASVMPSNFVQRLNFKIEPKLVHKSYSL